MSIRGRFLSALLLALLTMAGGCAQGGLGTLSVRIEGPSAASVASLGITNVAVTAKNGGVILNASIDIASGQSSCDFQSVLTGIWSVEANAEEETGKVVYSGRASVIVEKGMSSTAGIVLTPVDGEYELSIDLTDVDTAVVAKAEVWVYPLGKGTYTKKHTITEDLGRVHVMSATGITPQTYEFQIRLFDADGAPYYLSPWYLFDVLPASKTFVASGLEFSSFSIGLSVEQVPERPAILTAVATEGGGLVEVEMSWSQPGAAGLLKAQVYVRFFETERYDLAYEHLPGVMEEIASGVKFSMDSDDFVTSGKMWLRVVTVGLNGIPSLSSEQVLQSII